MRGLSVSSEEGSPNSCRAPPVGNGLADAFVGPGFAGRPRSAKLRKSHCLQPTERLKIPNPRLCRDTYVHFAGLMF